MGSRGVNGTGELESDALLRDEQHPGDGASVSGAERRPATDLPVTQEHRLPISGLPLGGYVLACPHPGRQKGAEPLDVSLAIHHELSKAVAQGVRLQAGRGVFLDWRQRGGAAKVEIGSDW